MWINKNESFDTLRKSVKSSFWNPEPNSSISTPQLSITTNLSFHQVSSSQFVLLNSIDFPHFFIKRIHNSNKKVSSWNEWNTAHILKLTLICSWSHMWHGGANSLHKRSFLNWHATQVVSSNRWRIFLWMERFFIFPQAGKCYLRFACHFHSFHRGSFY